MENQDKLFEQIKGAAKNAESKEFPSMDKVWARVEQKLDNEEVRKPDILWKRIAIAASLLLFLTMGYQFFKKDQLPVVKPDHTVVDVEPKDSVATKNPVVEIENPASTDEIQTPEIKPGAGKVLRKTVSEQQTVAEVDSIRFMKPAKMVVSVSETPIVNSAVTSQGSTLHWKGMETVTGVVSDQSGPIPGVNVVVKGTTRGVQTDFDGKYTIDVKKGEELIYSFIGMNNATAVVGESKKMDMTLSSGATLQEVTLEGYKKFNRKKTSIAQSTVTVTQVPVNPNETYTRQNFERKDKNFRDGDKQTSQPVVAAPNANVFQSLQGRVAGVNIAGQPGANSNIIIRGYVSDDESNDYNYYRGNVYHKDKIGADGKVELVKSNKIVFDTLANGKIIGREMPQIETTNEDYDPFIENQFESPKQAPLSTFSIDVDNASYTNVRRFINNGQTVPTAAVRVEEMINFFKYQYPQPKDKHPFSINTDYSECPWNPKHKLLRIGLQGKDIATESLPASNLVFLIDVSGSMSDANKLPLLKESMKVLVNELREKDKVSIVVYAGAAGLVLPPTSGSDKAKIIAALNNLNAGGSTAGGAGIELAYKTAQENFVKGGNNRVILATDGDFNVGSSSNTDMQTLIEEKRKSGVFLTCLGYGMGNYKDSKMEILSDKGNGNYAYIDNIQEANRFLGKEFKGSMFAIAKDVKIQIEFNPKHVQSYRLIGYENRKLRPEDFQNDAIDAGELGSGHTVTALYEIIPTGTKSDYFNETPELKYTQNQASGNFNDELATVKFRYKKPDGNKSIEMVKVIDNKPLPIGQTSEDFSFSAAVAWFGLKLRDSKLIGNKSSEDIKKLAEKAKSNDPDGYKAEFIRLVEAVR